VNRKIKEGIKLAFEAPEPTRKKEFLLAFEYPRTSRIDFFFSQIGYIRKRIWGISFLLVALALFGLPYQASENFLLWAVSSFTPFLVLIGITEIARSMSFNMAELEMSCKYNFSDIVLTRLGIIGIANAAVFILIILFFSRENSMLYLTIHLLTPYLMACALSLFFLNRFRGAGSIYVSSGASCAVSLISIALLNPNSPILQNYNWLLWIFLAMIAWTVFEVLKLIKRIGENEWNLSLTA